MAHTKSAGAAKYGRDSQPKYLGVKKHDGEKVKTGDILIRQRGTKVLAGIGVKRGGDDTLFALHEGIVKFATRRKTRFDGNRRYAKVVNIIPSSAK
jgi:large subunit ribosomal protein L27